METNLGRVVPPDTDIPIHEAPPPYAVTIMEEPPPSYDSIFGQIKDVQENTSGPVDCCLKVTMILCKAFGVTLFLGISLALPSSMIAVGTIYKNQCPAERLIPIFLIVFGVTTILSNLMRMKLRIQGAMRPPEEQDKPFEKSTSHIVIHGIVSLFNIAFYIAGNVWIYREYHDFEKNPNSSNYCHPTLYFYAFWLTTAINVVIGLFLCYHCICSCCGKPEGDHRTMDLLSV